MRQESDTDLMCHLTNIRHWNELSAPKVEGFKLLQPRLLAHGYLQILKQPRFDHDADRLLVAQEAEVGLSKYLNCITTALECEDEVCSVLDGLHVFTTGLVFMWLSKRDFTRESPNSAVYCTQTRQKQESYRALNALTMISMRYSAIRSLRDILAAVLAVPTGLEQIRSLVDSSEIQISPQLQYFLFA